jgi:FMN phosphatase YigB (HAD superfamily)
MSHTRSHLVSPQALFLDASGTLLYSDHDAPIGIAIFADALPILEAARSRRLHGRAIKTALITNWGRRVHAILAELGLQDCFDTVVSGDDVQRGKPSAEPFLLAATTLGVDPSACVHVGDSLRDDAFGAYDAGLQPIWLNRHPDRVLSREEERMVRGLPHSSFENLKDVLSYLEELFEKETDA